MSVPGGEARARAVKIRAFIMRPTWTAPSSREYVRYQAQEHALEALDALLAMAELSVQARDSVSGDEATSGGSSLPGDPGTEAHSSAQADTVECHRCGRLSTEEEMTYSGCFACQLDAAVARAVVREATLRDALREIAAGPGECVHPAVARAALAAVEGTPE